MSILKAACVQMTSGPDILENLSVAEVLIREAVAAGAQFIATPENTCQIRFPTNEKLESTPEEKAHPGLPFFSNLSEQLGVWLLIGSMSIKRPSEKLANRSFLFSDKGDIAATYDKIHLFDVSLPTGEVHRESDIIEAGSEAVIVDIGHAKLGLSICYDIRFSYLYRDLAKAGADILVAPAAFTVPTGKAHWKTLLRARAIETGSFVIAPAQTGEHENGRKTWGHSMIIDPWGEVLAEMDEKPGITVADLDLNDVRQARQSIPALKHDRAYKVKE